MAIKKILPSVMSVTRTVLTMAVPLLVDRHHPGPEAWRQTEGKAAIYSEISMLFVPATCRMWDLF